MDVIVTSAPRVATPSGRMRRWRTDIIAVAVLLLLTAVVLWVELRGVWGLTFVDIVVFFLPYYSFLGERLRTGDIPGWNPHQFGGAPFAGDAGSGWMYLPVMLLFTALPKITAMKALVAFHLALSGLSTYALARALRMGVLAAVVVASAYEFSTTLEYTRCCTAYVEISAWLPLALLGVELAVRAGDWLPRIAAWTVTGFAISQMFAGYPGQGVAYALLVTGAFIAYRTLVSPVAGRAGVGDRIIDFIRHGAATMLIGAGLGAAGILPRLAANAQSTVAGGTYQNIPTSEAMRPGWSLNAMLHYLLSLDNNHMRYYLGGATLALAILAPLLARRRYATPFFAIATFCLATLTLQPTPLHRLFYLIPRFQLLHEHYPSRALIAFNLGIALLAGATIAALQTWRGRPRVLITVGVAPLVLILVVRAAPAPKGAPMAMATIIAVAAVVALIALIAVARSSALRTGALVLLLVAVLADPAGWTFITRYTIRDRHNAPSMALLNAYQEETHGAAGFLRERQKTETFRYAGYDPLVIAPDGVYYPRFGWLQTPAALVNNRATYAGLDDISGYDPMQPARYRDLIDALNGGVTQNYHQANLLPAGFFSPLLDLLGVRYIVVPANERSTAIFWRELVKAYPTVYQDHAVRVLENEHAFPRAWIAHDAREAVPGGALDLMTSGRIDLRRTAVLETTPPAMGVAEKGQAETVAVDESQPDQVRLIAHATTPGLVMLSDTYDPGWQATVDGHPARLLVADHAFRAVAIPAGTHTVEMRFAPPSIPIGLAMTATTALGIGAAMTAIWWWERRKGRSAARTG